MVEKLMAALRAYYAVADALASDDFAQAQSALEPLLPALTQLGIETGAIEDAADIDALREGFDVISVALIAEVAGSGLDRVGNAYVNHCPMAFSNRGADWLSPSPEILNPLFGSMMLSCGTVKRNLSFESAPDGAAPVQEQHEHPNH